MSRRHWIVSCCLFAVAVACQSQPPKFQAANASVEVNAVLAPAQGRDGITGFVGAPPSVCLATSPWAELCEWKMGRREPGYTAIARAIRSDDYINLLCELPTDGSPRASDACSAYPQRSNRMSWSLPARSGRKGSRPVESREVLRSRYQSEADEAIAGAVTLVDLSRLMGAAPSECTAVSAGTRFCLWRTTSRTFGHGTLAMWIRVVEGKEDPAPLRTPRRRKPAPAGFLLGGGGGLSLAQGPLSFRAAARDLVLRLGAKLGVEGGVAGDLSQRVQRERADQLDGQVGGTVRVVGERLAHARAAFRSAGCGGPPRASSPASDAFQRFARRRPR